MNTHSRFIRVNGFTLRKLRIENGLTQKELGQRAGYCQRLIRKAENSGSLDLETVRNLAEALSTPENQVLQSHLTMDNRAIAMEWMNALNEHGPEMASHISHHLADDFVFHCPGLPETAPFIGTWHGIEGLLSFWRNYHQIFRRAPHQDVIYSVAEDLVIARYFETGYIGDQLCGPVRIHLVFYFRDGVIYRIDDDYDTLGGVIAKKKAEENIEARKQIAAAIVQCYDGGGKNVEEQLGGIATDDFELLCLSDSQEFPFTGTWNGKDGAANFFQKFYSLFSRKPNSLKVDYLISDNRIVAHFADQFSFEESELPSCWVSIHFHFREHLLFRIEYMFDQHRTKKDLDELGAKRGKKAKRS